MKRVSPWVAALTVAALSACGGDEEKPKPISGPAKQVAATITALERATAKRDFDTICDELLAAPVREQAGGGACPAQLRRTAAGVRDPRIAIRKIDIEGNKATVAVTTRARGQAPAEDTVVLVREEGQWRISQLSAPKK
ncbi:MAG: DUF3828 domain-containing protein [Thermoleophilaceae bacterium]|nr:DUF3828 domain-containing protein [Thermoleophilaceae bacterium]